MARIIFIVSYAILLVSCGEITDASAHRQAKNNKYVKEYLEIFPNAKTELWFSDKQNPHPDSIGYEVRLNNGAILIMNLPIKLSPNRRVILEIGEPEYAYAVPLPPNENLVIEYKNLQFGRNEWELFYKSKGDINALPRLPEMEAI